jgi:hypothetical protein
MLLYCLLFKKKMRYELADCSSLTEKLFLLDFITTLIFLSYSPSLSASFNLSRRITWIVSTSFFKLLLCIRLILLYTYFLGSSYLYFSFLVEAVIWLENYLSKWDRILLLISHSQDFLNNVCTHMIHFTNKGKLVYVSSTNISYVFLFSSIQYVPVHLY